MSQGGWRRASWASTQGQGTRPTDDDDVPQGGSQPQPPPSLWDPEEPVEVSLALSESDLT